MGHRSERLDKSVTARIPTRTNTDDRYFGDKHQAMPAQGYTAMFNRMLDHPNIDVLLSDRLFRGRRDEVDAGHIVFTGPIDEYFGHCYGKLPYRSLRFDHRTLETEQFQPVAVVNYPDPSVPYTRITEYKHLTGQRHRAPASPTNIRATRAILIIRSRGRRIRRCSSATRRSRSDGAMSPSSAGSATYRYYNMDQVVGQALATHRKLEFATNAEPPHPSPLPAGERECSAAAGW
jgi:UDP-galactopyranose mutase